MSATILIKQETCYACAVRCKRVVQVNESDYGSVDPLYGGPEYETLAAFGSLEGNDDLISLAKANELCAAYGFDTISLGNVIAFAMECYERELISPHDTDGLDLKFGNARAMLTLIDKITRREGFGNVLADGVARAAQQIGRGASEFAMQIHGQEIPMHEPRLKQGLGIGYAVSPTGADHNHNIHDTDYVKEGFSTGNLRELDPAIHALPLTDLSADKVRIVVTNTNWLHMWDSAVMCMFLPYTVPQMTNLMNAVTGWDLAAQDYARIGERAATMARVYNLREGWDPKQDTLPHRFFEPFQSGPLAGTAVPADQFAAATHEYYRQMGWDENGVPTRERLQQLGLQWLADRAQ